MPVTGNTLGFEFIMDDSETAGLLTTEIGNVYNLPLWIHPAEANIGHSR